MFNFKRFILVLILLVSTTLKSEPWVNTKDEFLRADIEILSDIGVINSPITMYPLMWAGLIKDLDNTQSEQIPAAYRDIFWRVKLAAKRAIGFSAKEMRLSLSNSENPIRQFGDSARGETEFAARRTGMNKHFAWNLEVTYVDNPLDGDDIRADGSYVSAIMGNWSLSLGAVEKWWGPSWNSANLLSNNARPPLGVSLQRNYSVPFEIPVLEWLGPWSFNTFIAELDEQRAIKDTRLIGASFNFKPVDSLEIGLRSTALWGGEERVSSFNSFADTLMANEECQQGILQLGINCDGYFSERGNRLGGADIRWRLPISYPVSIYASSYSEREDGFFTKSNLEQIGITSSFKIGNTHIKWFVESSDTGVNEDFNRVYEHPVYLTGYRYKNSAIGSTYDNDSESISFGLKAILDKYNQVSLTLSEVELNKDGLDINHFSTGIGGHSLANEFQEYTSAKVKWQYQTRNYGRFDFIAEYFEEEFEQIETNIRVNWTFSLEN